MIDCYQLIKNVKIIDSPHPSARHGNILIKKQTQAKIDKIVGVGDFSLPTNSKITLTKADGAFACPGFIDLRAHLCAKGGKRDAPAVLEASKRGGYSLSIICPDEKADNAPIDNGVTRLEFLLSAFDIQNTSKRPLGVYDDGSLNAAALQDVMRYCKEQNLTLFLKCEEHSMSGGVMNEGERARQMKAPMISPLCEELALAKYLLLAKNTGCKIHVHAISTKGSVDMLRQAKKDGVNVSADTCPQYFSLTEDQILFKGSVAKVDPPLRSISDVGAVIEGLADGTIDAISTDHTPCDNIQKRRSIMDAPFGMIMLESAFLIGITNLVEKGHLSIFRLVDAMCFSPMRILGIDPQNAKGLNLFSIDGETYALRTHFAGGYTNSAFEGWQFSGKLLNYLPCEW